MTDFDKKLDEIAGDAFQLCHSAFVNREHDMRVIKKAMLAAIELYAQREPSATVLAEGERVLRASGRLFGKTAHDRVTAGEEFRAMQAAQLKEIKENSNG